MDIYKPKFTRLQQGIFRLLCIKAGQSLSQREIARLLKVSPTAIGKAVKGMDLIKVEKSSMNLNSISLDRDKAISLKRAENLRLIHESGLADHLEESFPGCAIILFGSYSMGEDTVSSDIDIAVIGSKEKKIDPETYERLLERDININHYQELSAIKKNLRENIINGIVLSGHVEL